MGRSRRAWRRGTRDFARSAVVDILRPVSLTAALELEELWNELLTARRISLLCGYSVDAFDPEAYRGLLQDVSAAHSHLVPVEDYARLDQAVDSAFVEIFGAARDARFFRRTFIDHYQRPAAMPDAQAAILATRQFVPEAVVALLDRARHHYHSLRHGGLIPEAAGGCRTPQVKRPNGPRSSFRSSGVSPNRRASARIACSSLSSASPTASVSSGVRVPSSTRRMA